MAKQKITLSKDLPGQKVSIPEELKSKSYYKYFQVPFEDIPADLRASLTSFKGTKEEALEPEDRTKLFEVQRWPRKDGVYPLKKGGLLVASNVKLPNMTAEALNWWGAWHAIDPLRYALWDPQDHYDIRISEEDRKRILDPAIPDAEKLWGLHHHVLESLDQDEPTSMDMQFLNPFDYGYDKSMFGTDRCLGVLSAKTVMGGKLPVFMTEVCCIGEDGVLEIRLRFWLGYEIRTDGTVKCKIPKFIKVPQEIAKSLIIHNHREYRHLDKFLMDLYAEEKDNWA